MEPPAFYGELIRSRVAGPFAVTESAFRGGSTLPMHTHELPYFTFTLQGSYRERYGTKWRLCTPGTGVGHPALESHSQVFDREPVLLIRVAPHEELRERAGAIEVERPTQRSSALLERSAWQLHRELLCWDEYSETIVEELAHELAGHALRGADLNGGSRKRALRAELLIRSSLRRPMPASAIAAELGVSRATLYRDFKTVFGRSPGGYLRRARIDAAAGALRKSERPVAEIAAECGFYDQSHFDRCFRSALGLSPSEYRRNAR
jgi:AraC family transcriptional regulator